ncbi:(4Fe-4S)-binding protein [Tamlana sp. 2201CG12-4]|uniref:(4Fe-4S)-binding protein n=1 Tax=Tamlana sp. 2201CG12-4 TaxID=3112582 RepID=UPI002DB558A5|nr:(4Fe-4S)-binding protein [Tamlana sp. 2201CG12-4]MEC3907284.1 (4Fe-4S)-binding protein [Tamlana sp. 2201CG12-4]
MKTNDNEFSNGEITVTYDPTTCILSGKCAKELSDVFCDSIIPWINLEYATNQAIIKQIKRCPSGALKYSLNIKKKAS